MRSPFAYLDVISLMYGYTCAITITTITAESSIQKSQARTLLKQRAAIEESPIDYGSLRACKQKSVSRRTLPTIPALLFFSSSTSAALLLNF